MSCVGRLGFYKDVFCNDLDDCFYLNCDDNENSNTCDVNCCDSQVDEICCTNDKCLEPKLEQPPSCEKSEHLECCDDPHCESYNVCHSDLGDLSSVVCTDLIALKLILVVRHCHNRHSRLIWKIIYVNHNFQRDLYLKI